MLAAFAAAVPPAGGAMQAVAKQVDGHPEVVVKNAAHTKGTIVARVPNGDPATILQDYGEYIFVRWHDVEGYVRAENVVRVQAPAQTSQCTTTRCVRQSWNGQPNQPCCSKCVQKGGREHGANCQHRWDAQVPAVAAPPVVAGANVLQAPKCGSGCFRFAAAGFAACWRPCVASGGSQHGPRCEETQIKTILQVRPIYPKY